MAKTKFLSVFDIPKDIKTNGLKPIYYVFGEDTFSFDYAKSVIEKTVTPLLASEFDKETYYGSKNSFTEILSAASTFPFGDGKKFLIVKNAEKPKDKDKLADYAESPSEFTIMLLFHEGTITKPDSEPYKTLSKLGEIFESKEMKGDALVEWVKSYVKENQRNISDENAQLLIDIVGENRSLIELQLEKIFLYLDDNKEITLKSIQQLATELKQFNIFDLINAIGRKEKSKALEIAFNLYESGTEMIQIIAMLNRYFSALAKIDELNALKMSDQEAARIVGTHPFYYKNYLEARKRYDLNSITNAFRALFNADLTIKTSPLDQKTVLTMLIAEIIPD
ncbi:DNA polymerase III subunit delta [Ignavibacterium album JCM 16511]|uniref:DNA polymerase III subunit delta n=1 Tax=Ignavibacterium album (strain DSM 19864 / JCM 16511 / NBRC 101810 / Mat9-16) TaxID=945713 RepID=I0AHB2_IGNAJ|nr:DNA polymerase III subunit delta [Ignavibacterium album]AFH48369.1 DNA polymerase III subunit delta [Ignavibacterium album JCM 16511]